MPAFTMKQFLDLLHTERNRAWVLDGQRIRCDGRCPIEIVFPALRNAFNADTEGLLSEEDEQLIIDAADNGFSSPPNEEVRQKLLLAVGLAASK